MKNVSRAVLLMFFAAMILPAAAANLTGVVRDATAETATVETTGDVLPAIGDKVEIFFELAGTDVSVATGHVQEVAAGKVVVKIDTATGTVEADQRARFTSNPSQKPGGPSGPASSLTPSQAPVQSTPAVTPPPKFAPGSTSTKSSPPPSTALQTPALKPVPLPTDGPDDAIPGAHYAAIAYSPTTGKWGSARHYKSKNAAMAHARSECGQIDAPAAWCRNGWVALAISDQQPGIFGSTWGTTANAAREAARRECLKRSSDARVVLCISSSGK